MVEPPQACPKRVISFVLAVGFAFQISTTLVRGGDAKILPIAPNMDHQKLMVCQNVMKAVVVATKLLTKSLTSSRSQSP